MILLLRLFQSERPRDRSGILLRMFYLYRMESHRSSSPSLPLACTKQVVSFPVFFNFVLLDFLESFSVFVRRAMFHALPAGERAFENKNNRNLAQSGFCSIFARDDENRPANLFCLCCFLRVLKKAFKAMIIKLFRFFELPEQTTSTCSSRNLRNKRQM